MVTATARAAPSKNDIGAIFMLYLSPSMRFLLECADTEHEELADQARIGVEVGGETSTLLKSA